VIGGGIAGLFACLELAEAGERVLLLERGTLGCGATRAAAGLLAPVHELEATETELVAAGFASQRMHYAWAERQGWNVGLRREGALEVALTQADLPYVRRRYEQLLAHGLNVAWLNAAELHALEPGLATSVPGGIFTPDDAQLDNRALVDALATSCRAAGAEIREGCEVHEVHRDGEELILTTTTGPISAKSVVVATGASPAIAGFAAEVVTPVRGQMLSLSPPEGGLIAHPIRIQSRTYGYGYLVPKADRIVVGSTAEEMGYDSQLTAGGLMDILRRAYAAVPGIYELSIQEVWTGFRPATASRLPVVRRHPEWPLVWVNGLYRHGILMGPLMAHAAVCLLQSKPQPEEVQALGRMHTPLPVAL
jgi:glycine oxidase